MIGYVFRRPKYPLLIETDVRVFGAKNGQKIERLLSKGAFLNKDNYIVIDSSGEGWSFSTEHFVIHPMTLLKRWSKVKIIELYNASLANAGFEQKFEHGNLSNKNMTKIIYEIVDFDAALK